MRPPYTKELAEKIERDRSGGYEEGYIVAAAYRWGSEGTQALVAEVEAITGRPVTAFYGCYEGNEFTIP